MGKQSPVKSTLPGGQTHTFIALSKDPAYASMCAKR